MFNQQNVMTKRAGNGTGEKSSLYKKCVDSLNHRGSNDPTFNYEIQTCKTKMTLAFFAQSCTAGIGFGLYVLIYISLQVFLGSRVI